MNVLVKYLRDISQSGPTTSEMSGQSDEVGDCSNLEQLAYERGVEDTLLRASATIEQALSAFGESTASLQAQWTMECQDRVCREADVGRSLIEERLSAELAKALSPFIEAKQRDRIREAFLQCLQEALTANAEAPIRLFGPADETRIVVDRLGQKGITAIYHERNGPVIDAEIGSRIVRADFASWSRRWLEEFGDLDVPA